MNSSSLKYYATEVIFGVTVLILIISFILVYISYQSMWKKESELSQLQSAYLITHSQIKKLSDATDQELEQWGRLRNLFYLGYPSSAPLPESIRYNTAQKTFEGSEIPIDSHALYIYKLLYGIAGRLYIDEIQISANVPKISPKQTQLIDSFLQSATIDFQFVAPYRYIMQFAEELQRLPVVFKIENIRITEASRRERHKGASAKISTRYFFRKDNTGLE